MYGILFQVFYSTRHNAKLPVSVDKLFVFINASTGIEACEKAIQLLDMDRVEVEGCVKMI